MHKLKRIKIWFSVIKSFLLTFNGIENNILDSKNTVKEIIKKKSFIRFGDGEFGIYMGKDIHYQKWSEELKNDFLLIKKDYEDNINCNYLLAVPKKFMTANGFWLMKKRVYVSSWSESRYYFKKFFQNKLIYGDSFLFEKGNENIYSGIWNNEKCPNNVIFIHRSNIYADEFAKKYNKNIYYVQCSSKNAYEEISKTENIINEILTKNNLTVDNVMLTISAGPAGKVLVYRFSKKGYWCIDTGHCWDDPLEVI